VPAARGEHERWRAGLLSDGHGIPIIAIRRGRLREANRPARDLFARTDVGMDVVELFDESCRDKLESALERGAVGETVELVVPRPERPPLAARTLVLGTKGEEVLVVGDHGLGYTDEIGAKLMAANTELANVTRELSRRMHELDAARQELQRLGALRELFIAALAHDLRGPLNVVLMAEDLLRGKRAPMSGDEVARHTDKVERSARRMLRLIDSLLLAARLDAPNQPAHESFELLELDDIARTTAHEVEISELEGDVRIEIDASEPLRVRGQRDKLEQVFANLLSNALRYAPAKTAVVLALRAEGRRARCDVSDRGPGVAPEERASIFERFTQRGDRPGSIGLGLYICRKVLDLHGGDIWVEDNPGGGARFSFVLPLSA
jgi:signal transduction histidine kinase